MQDDIPAEQNYDWPHVAGAAGFMLSPIYYPRAVERLLCLQAPHSQASWLIACSGGADSVALLFSLWHNYPKMRERMVVAHFDHALRSASRMEAAFVRHVAISLGLRYVEARWERAPGDPTDEASARKARLAALEQLVPERPLYWFTGHQADDVAESLLMNLGRGSGLEGLAGPRPVHALPGGITRVRPLLHLSREEVRLFLRSSSAFWCEDASNAQDTYLRNRVRARVLPVWREVQDRDIARGTQRGRMEIEEALEAIDAWLAQLGWTPESGLPSKLLHPAPIGVWRRALQLWLQAQGLEGRMDPAEREVLLGRLFERKIQKRSILGGQIVWLPKVGLQRASQPTAQSNVKTAPKSAEKPVQVTPVSVPEPGLYPLWAGGGTLEITHRPVTQELWGQLRGGGLGPYTECFSLHASRFPWTVCPRRAGDSYRPLGARGRSKLQDLMVNAKWSLEDRALRPVLFNDSGQILWVPGLLPAEIVRLLPSDTECLQVRWWRKS